MLERRDLEIYKMGDVKTLVEKIYIYIGMDERKQDRN